MKPPFEHLTAPDQTADGPSISHWDDPVTMADLTRILDIRFGNLTNTRLWNMPAGIAEECLIDSLKYGAVEASDGKVRQGAQ